MSIEPYYKCPNYEVCGQFVTKPGRVCENCKQDARLLSATLQAEADRERLGQFHGSRRRPRDRRWRTK